MQIFYQKGLVCTGGTGCCCLVFPLSRIKILKKPLICFQEQQYKNVITLKAKKNTQMLNRVSLRNLDYIQLLSTNAIKYNVPLYLT